MIRNILGLHAPVQGATNAFNACRANLGASCLLWTAAEGPQDATTGVTNLVRLPTPRQGERAPAYLARVHNQIAAWYASGIPAIFIPGNEPDLAESSGDVSVAWTRDAWEAAMAEIVPALRGAWQQIVLGAPAYSVGNMDWYTARYAAPFDVATAHAYWWADKDEMDDIHAGGAWRHATGFGKPVYITECNSNPTTPSKLGRWAAALPVSVTGVCFYICDDAGHDPQYTITPEDAAAIRATYDAPPAPVPVPVPPPEAHMDLIDAIQRVTQNPRTRGAMLMGAALETGQLTYPFPDQVNGPAVGPFQIEAKEGGWHYGRISVEDARDPLKAAQYMVGSYESAVAGIGDGDWQADPMHAYAQAAHDAERPAVMYPEDRIVRAWSLVAPLVGTPPVPPPTRYQIVTPVDCPVVQGSDGTYSHAGASPGFYAIDYGCGVGMPIRAAADGIVGVQYWTDSNPISLRTGHSTWIDHDNGYSTFSCHQSRFDVATGDQVKQGQIIGLTGAPGNGNGFGDGPHLHWEIWDTAHHVRVKMEDLEAAGIAGPWNGQEDDVTIRHDGRLDDGVLAWMWAFRTDVETRAAIACNPDSALYKAWKADLDAGKPWGVPQTNEHDLGDRVLQMFSNGVATYVKATGEVFFN